MRSRSRRPISTLTSDKWSEPAAWVEVRRLPVRRELKRTRESRGRTSPLDHKVVRRCSHFVAISERVPLPAREDHRAGQTRLIRSDKLWRTPEQAGSFVDRNKMCT